MATTQHFLFETPLPYGITFDAARAAELNRQYAQTLGWQPHYGRIAQLLGFSAITPAESAFAAALARWQSAQGLKSDGILGPISWARLQQILNGRPSSPGAPAAPSGFFRSHPVLMRAALAPSAPLAINPNWPSKQRALAATYNRLGGLIGALAAQTRIEVPAVLAIWQVESGGRQHTPGRAIIRFENHLFYRSWGAANQALYNQHFRHGGNAGQPGKAWENHQFRTSTSASFQNLHDGQQATEYRALELAIRLGGDTAAIKSISMGGPQILGSNHQLIGYPSPRAMYDAFQADERTHVLGFFDFCQQTSAPARGDLLRYLRERRWADFARYYNGPGQVATYGAWIQAAYEQARALPIAER